MGGRKLFAMTLGLILAVALAAGAASRPGGHQASRGGYAALQPGTLVTLPFVGRLSWNCRNGARSATFTAPRPVATQTATLTGDGRRLATVTLGLRTRQISSPMGSWQVLSFHITGAGEPGSVGVTLTVTFRVLPPPSGQCYVPRFTVTERTRSHEVAT